MHGGERVAEVLRAQGIDRLFTLCGGHVSPILTAACERDIEVVDVRDEATAVFAADATARLTGCPGVAVVTAGPGATNTITAVKNAQLAQSPVLVIGGAAPTVLQGRGALQDIDQMALFRPHVKLAMSARRRRDVVSAVMRCLREARADVPGPVFLELPIDVLYPEELVRKWYGVSSGGAAVDAYIKQHLNNLFAGASEVEVTGTRWKEFPAVPERGLRRAAKALGQAQRPVLLVGSQALCRAGDAAALAEAVTALGMPTYLSGMARGLLGTEHPLLLRHHRRLALREADCVVLAGVPADFRLDYGRHIRRRARVLAANRCPSDLHRNRRANVPVLADAGEFLVKLAGALEAPLACDEWRQALRNREAEREAEIAEAATHRGEHVNAVRLCREIDALLDEHSTVVADGGDFIGTAAYTVRPHGPLRWLDPGAFGTLGVGAGFALGAARLRPGDETWALFGDGALGWSLVEFDTFARHGVPVIAVVGNDGCWSQIAREQVKTLGDAVGTALAHTAYHRAVEGLGCAGLEIRHDDEIGETLAEARRLAGEGRPVLVNALLDRSDFREGSISM